MGFCSAVLHQLNFARSAGHSKWANIKHIKEANIFSKYARMIRIGEFQLVSRVFVTVFDSSHPTHSTLIHSNPRRRQRQPPDELLPKNSHRPGAVKEHADGNDREEHQEVQQRRSQTHPAFLRDQNPGKSLRHLRSLHRKSGWSQAARERRREANNTAPADLRHSFEEIGYVQVTAANCQAANASEFEDFLTEHAIECDAQEVENIDFDSKSATFICRPIDIEKVKRSLLNLKYIVDDSQHIFVPTSVLKLNENEAKVYEGLKVRLSQLDGYENIFDNVDTEEATA
jgi:hypothetical protein